MPSVSFNPDLFKQRYTEFAAVSDELLQLYFNEACMYLDNKETSRVTDLTERSLLLNMITAHIAKINNSGVGSPAAAGRVSQATEGSVSVSFDMAPSKGGLQAWFYQTQYGLSYWAATARYRTFLYTSTWQSIV
jgi:hypothetical protein